jgi:hypothetical protein
MRPKWAVDVPVGRLGDPSGGLAPATCVADDLVDIYRNGRPSPRNYSFWNSNGMWAPIETVNLLTTPQLPVGVGSPPWALDP